MTERLERLLARRILILDGAMGTMIQGYGLGEEDYRGEIFADRPGALRGCHDLLSLTRPALIEEIHRKFLDAGADIIETNTFSANRVSLADYGMEDQVVSLNRASAELAVRVAREATRRTPERPRFVAGSLGPTNRTASISPRVDDPGFRAITFPDLVEAYAEQVRGLMAGGVDLLLPETTFDTLNLKAALFAVGRVFEELGRAVPVVASLTITDASGRTLSGQTLEAAWISIAHADLFGVSLNCALGAAEMRPYLEELARLSSAYLFCYPNAGLPNEFGGYDQTPDDMARVVADFAREGWLNVVGGCCGTTPEHIRAIAEAVRGRPPRRPSPPSPYFQLSGLEPLTVRPDSNFIVIGERTNITGSRAFARLIRAGRFEEALEVARRQVEGGANILDVNMDEGLLDSEAAMTRFLHLLSAEPAIARLPIMIDSSRFSVIEAGLRCLQGKAIVNSISLKEGEEEFRRQARIIRRHGAAVVVMAFDQEGQATTSERRMRIFSRAHRVLTEEIGFPERDIIFDPNVLTVATGIEEHNDHARSFFESVRRLKAAFPGVKVSAGVSNVSFSFRGNEAVRDAMHAAFLYHAIQAGLDMGIVNAGQLAVYEEIPRALRDLVEDVLLNRRPDATDRLLAYADEVKGGNRRAEREEEWRKSGLAERFGHALVHGIDRYLEEDLTEALRTYPEPLTIIEGPLMSGMNVVGDLFGAGKMFLPQVVKSARVMKRAVAFLQPHLEREKQRGSARGGGKILLATVKGDVHDIGKNIVGVVLGCNNHEIIDLGVMAPAERIVRSARECRADIVGLSGLITPSLDEMVHVAAEMRREGMTVPLLIGGATTSRKHTSVKIAPGYDGTTVHVTDASRAVDVVGRLLNPNLRPDYVRRIQEEQEQDRRVHARPRTLEILPYSVARERRPSFDWRRIDIPRPSFLGVRAIDPMPLSELVPYIDWSPFFQVWELKGVYPKILDHPKYGAAARDLFEHARATLRRIVEKEELTARGVYGFFPAASEGDDIILYEDEDRRGERARIHTLRQQTDKGGAQPQLALADFVAPAESERRDHIGCFAVTAGHGAEELAAACRERYDDYEAIVVKALADRLAEAFAELLHERARREWGYGSAEAPSKEDLIREAYRGIRPAPGYPACPDHTEKETLWSLLDAERSAGIRLTESFAMMPAASVSGYYLAHPEAKYFHVGPIGRDQVEAYAARKGLPAALVERWLAPNLSYDR